MSDKREMGNFSQSGEKDAGSAAQLSLKRGRKVADGSASHPGTLLAHAAAMTKTARVPENRNIEPAAILRWTFLQGSKAMPHWHRSSSFVEQYAVAAHALSRHAEIARRFRQAGWTLVRERSLQRADLAA
jgi:hypothetical protein